MREVIDYIAVPVWDGSQWVPRNFAGDKYGSAIIPWPDGFDPATLPRPPVQLRETVRFYFGPHIMQGEIREIQLHGGCIYKYEDKAAVIQERYALDKLRLTIYANGHGRWASLKDLIR